MKTPPALCALALTAALCACSQPAAPPAHPAADRETKAFDSFKGQYKDVITGVNAAGTTLDVFVNLDQMDSMDEDAENMMKAQALQRWRNVWKANHPGKHATLRVRLRDYYGEVQFTETSRV